jgi:hypothetical protein
VPDPLSIIRLVALLVFIGLVAVGLWLLDVAWWVVPPVMALALLIAWTIEWLAWRGTLTTGVIRETTVASPAVPPPAVEEHAVEEPPLPAEAIVPVAPTAPATHSAPAPEPVPEPEGEGEVPPLPGPEPPAPEPEPGAASEPELVVAPQPEPAPPPAPEPEPEPPSALEPEPEPPASVAKTPEPPSAPAAPSPEPKRRRRMRLRSVPAPLPEPRVEAAPPAETAPPTDSPVVAFPARRAPPRSWNLWDLERIAREGVRAQPERRDEFAYLFLHLRQFAAADGSLPTEFDGLVRESFAGMLDRSGA